MGRVVQGYLQAHSEVARKRERIQVERHMYSGNPLRWHLERCELTVIVHTISPRCGIIFLPSFGLHAFLSIAMLSRCNARPQDKMQLRQVLQWVDGVNIYCDAPKRSHAKEIYRHEAVEQIA
jgi:hypothetical protein